MYFCISLNAFIWFCTNLLSKKHKTCQRIRNRNQHASRVNNKIFYLVCELFKYSINSLSDEISSKSTISMTSNSFSVPSLLISWNFLFTLNKYSIIAFGLSSCKPWQTKYLMNRESSSNKTHVHTKVILVIQNCQSACCVWVCDLSQFGTQSVQNWNKSPIEVQHAHLSEFAGRLGNGLTIDIRSKHRNKIHIRPVVNAVYASNNFNTKSPSSLKICNS